MKKRNIKILAGTFAFACLLGGCSIGGRRVVFTNGLSSRDVFSIEDTSCELAQARVYLANYQNIYGKSYGIDLWEQGFQNEKLTEYIKEITLSEMAKVICMDLLAKEQGISLTQDDLEHAREAAAQYYKSLNEAEKSYMGVSETDIASMYEDYALASKVYQSLTKGVDEEVSDDEARIMEAMQIYLKDKSEADEAGAMLAAGEDFAAVASNYNKKTAVEIIFGRGEMPKEVEDVAFELDNGEVSGCIAAEDGYYFIKCVNKFNEELTDANKSNIVEAREKAAFDDVYEKFASGLAVWMNETVWEENELITDGSITTDSFFEIIEGVMD